MSSGCLLFVWRTASTRFLHTSNHSLSAVRESTMSNDRFNDSQSVSTAAILTRFNQVFLSHNPADLDALVADDCVIENTRPAPDGSRHEGKAACIALW